MNTLIPLDQVVMDHLETVQTRYQDLNTELYNLGRYDLAKIYNDLVNRITFHRSELNDLIGGGK